MKLQTSCLLIFEVDVKLYIQLRSTCEKRTREGMCSLKTADVLLDANGHALT